MSARTADLTTLLIAMSCALLSPISGVVSPARALTIDLKATPPDFTVYGAQEDDIAAQAVLFGDLNGDGRSDMIVGAPGVVYSGRNACGAVYVVYSSDTLQTPIDLSTERDDVRVILGPETESRVGSRIACGNVDGDRYDDLVIGVPTASPNGTFFAGEVYVVFGGVVPLDSLDLLTPGLNVVRIQGANVFDRLGDAVSVGDVNDDTFADVIAAAPLATANGRTYAGEVFVVYGDPDLPGVIEVGTTFWAGIRIFGSRANDTFGTACFSADVTNDGVADIVVGAPQAQVFTRAAAGIGYVIPGGPSLPDTIDTLDENGPPMSKILGAEAGALNGSGFGAADIDGDQATDFLIGSPELSPGGRTAAGALYALGGAVGLPDTVDLAAPPANTVRIDGPAANIKIGRKISSGDFNLDSADDVAIGLPGSTFQVPPEGQPRLSAGTVSVVFGRGVFPPVIDLAAPQTGITTILGAASLENTGVALASGRMNADAFDDLFIGASGAANGGKFSVGKALVILGSAEVTPAYVLFYDADAAPGSVRLEWRLRDDMDGGLIEVYRSDGGEDDFVRLPSDGLSRIAAGHFVYEDREVRGGATYTYTAATRESERQTLFSVTVTVPRFGAAAFHPNFPNPFRDATTLAFDIPNGGRVAVSVYDVRGALVASIADRNFAAGTTTLEWNGRSSGGALVPSGVYFARMTYSGITLERKLLLLR